MSLGNSLRGKAPPANGIGILREAVKRVTPSQRETRAEAKRFW